MESKQESEISISGEALSKQYCTGCHMYPEPGLLDKNTWQFGVLPQMAYRFGIYNEQARSSLIEKGQGGQLVEQGHIFPSEQILTDQEWELIQNFYHENAPDKLTIPAKEINMNIEGLEVRIPDFHVAPAMITAIAFNKETNEVYVADTKPEYSAINILDRKLNSKSTLALPSPISHLSYKADTIIATLMGSFMPSDAPSGSLIKIFKRPGESEYKGFVSMIKGLQRPVQTTLTDINNDKLEDVIICEFGNHTGKLSLFVKQKNGQYDKRVLSKDPGAVAVQIIDLNKDGLKDIIVLISQGRERIEAHYNLGDKGFESRILLDFPASYGSASFSMLDWNNDGFEDIIYVNGDNADYSRSLKPYHGLRIYLNDGKNNFKEAFFQHQDGAYKAIAKDFDKDGDIDISLISYFPNLKDSPEEGYIFMENIGKGEKFKFKLRSFEQAAQGRWLVMESVDLGNRRGQGLLLGSFTGMAINEDESGEIAQDFAKKSPSLMLLNFD